MIPLSLSEYYDQLDAHDWWYQISDDSKKYKAGRAEQARLRSIASQSDAHRDLYERMEDHKLSSHLQTPHPKPERPNV